MDGQIASGKPLTDKELQEHQRQQQEQQERVKQRAEALVRKIGETCDELDRLAEENPELVGRVAVGSEEHKEAYLRLKARLQLADQAPRCRWVRQDGTGCGSPQMKRHIYCFAHAQMLEAQALALRLPAMEDANAIQIGLMRIQKALLEDTISTKKAGLMLYSMQLGLQNVGQTTFGKVAAREMVTDTVSVEQAVREDVLTTQGTEEDKNSPLMNTDDTDRKRELPRTSADPRQAGTDGRGPAGDRKPVSGTWPQQVEYKLPMNLYRMDTREGMEAYEAEFRRRIAGGIDARGRRIPPLTEPDDGAQTHANLG
jgi:hypothetical protein